MSSGLEEVLVPLSDPLWQEYKIHSQAPSSDYVTIKLFRVKPSDDGFLVVDEDRYEVSYFNKFGELHNIFGPALICLDAKTKTITEMEYWINGNRIMEITPVSSEMSYGVGGLSKTNDMEFARRGCFVYINPKMGDLETKINLTFPDEVEGATQFNQTYKSQIKTRVVGGGGMYFCENRDSSNVILSQVFAMIPDDEFSNFIPRRVRNGPPHPSRRRLFADIEKNNTVSWDVLRNPTPDNGRYYTVNHYFGNNSHRDIPLPSSYSVGSTIGVSYKFNNSKPSDDCAKFYYHKGVDVTESMKGIHAVVPPEERDSDAYEFQCSMILGGIGDSDASK